MGRAGSEAGKAGEVAGTGSGGGVGRKGAYGSRGWARSKLDAAKDDRANERGQRRGRQFGAWRAKKHNSSAGGASKPQKSNRRLINEC